MRESRPDNSPSRVLYWRRAQLDNTGRHDKPFCPARHCDVEMLRIEFICIQNDRYIGFETLQQEGAADHAAIKRPAKQPALFARLDGHLVKGALMKRRRVLQCTGLLPVLSLVALSGSARPLPQRALHP